MTSIRSAETPTGSVTPVPGCRGEAHLRVGGHLLRDEPDFGVAVGGPLELADRRGQHLPQRGELGGADVLLQPLVGEVDEPARAPRVGGDEARAVHVGVAGTWVDANVNAVCSPPVPKSDGPLREDFPTRARPSAWEIAA